MAGFMRREVVTRRVEYVVPASVAIGAFDAAFRDVCRAAKADFCRHRGLDPDTAAPPEDWAMVNVRDGELVITVTIPDRAMASEPGS